MCWQSSLDYLVTAVARALGQGQQGPKGPLAVCPSNGQYALRQARPLCAYMLVSFKLPSELVTDNKEANADALWHAKSLTPAGLFVSRLFYSSNIVSPRSIPCLLVLHVLPNCLHAALLFLQPVPHLQTLEGHAAMVSAAALAIAALSMAGVATQQPIVEQAAKEVWESAGDDHHAHVSRRLVGEVLLQPAGATRAGH